MVVHGKNVAFEMLEVDNYIPLLCATDCTYSRNVEFVEKTGPTSGGSREWKRRLHEHISTVSGLTEINNSTTHLSFFYLLSITAEKTFRMTFEDEVGNLYSLTGPGLLGTMGINGPAADFSNGTIEVRWNGQPDTTVILPPAEPGVYELYINESNGLVVGATDVSHVDLEATGVEVLGSVRTGTGLIQVGGTPAAGSQEFRFIGGTGNGTIVTDSTNPYNAGEWIYVLYKIV